MYPSDKWTEQELQKLEKRLADVYKQARKELDGKARNYFKQFSHRYAKEYAAYQAGKYTKKEFEAWLMNQYGRGQRWEALREDMARRLAESNEIAAAYINEKTPLVIALNHNFEAYMIKSLVSDRQMKEIGDIAFNLVDEYTVKRLTVKKQKILPPRRVLKSKDVRWNKKKLQNAPIVSLQLVSTTERPMRILRFMMRTPISKNILTSVLYRILMRMAGVRFISVISSL
mgnify:FL=1